MKKSLRTRLIDYMTLNRYSPWTRKNYLGTMRQLAKYHKKSPDLLSNEEIQDYLLHLLQKRKLAWGSCCNVHLSGLACFYKNVLNWEETQFTDQGEIIIRVSTKQKGNRQVALKISVQDNQCAAIGR